MSKFVSTIVLAASFVFACGACAEQKGKKKDKDKDAKAAKKAKDDKKPGQRDTKQDAKK